MTSETQVSVNDRIRLNLLKEVLEGTVILSLQFGTEPAQDYAKDIHEEGRRVYVCGRFNISEDAGGEHLTIRPVSAGMPLVISLTARGELTDKKISLINGRSKEIEKEFAVTQETQSVGLLPQDGQGFTLRITSDGELQEIQREISAVEAQRDQLAQKKRNARQHLETIQSEFQKDQAAYQGELDELKAQTDVDEAILKHYADRGITPTQTLLDEARAKLDEAEAQIRLFIEAKQRKTMEIENEIKSNKRQ